MQFENHKNYNCEITLDDGRKYLVNAKWIQKSNLNFWESWKCEVGVTRIMIDSDLTVYSGECLNDKLGDLLNGWELLTESATCKRIKCAGSAIDLMVSKRKERNE